MCISYAFIQSLVTKCLVPVSKGILHYKNMLVSSTSFQFTRMHYLAGPAPRANIVKKSSPWGPQYCTPDFNIAPLVA